MAPKLRVHELAKELGMTNKETLDLALELGIGVKTHSSSIEDAQADRVRRKAEREGLIRDVQPEEPAKAKKASKKVVKAKKKVAKSAKQAPAKTKKAKKAVKKAAKKTTPSSKRAAKKAPATKKVTAKKKAAPKKKSAPKPAPKTITGRIGDMLGAAGEGIASVARTVLPAAPRNEPPVTPAPSSSTGGGTPAPTIPGA